MSRWLEAFQEKDFPHMPQTLQWLTKPDWCPPSTRICVTKDGSIDGDIIKAAVHHVKSFIQEHVSPDKAVVLVLDGHASRNSMEWLQYSAENNLEIVRLPANTSHFYNPATKRLTVSSSNRFDLCVID